MRIESGKSIRDVLILAAVCILAVFLFLSVYQNDNKYTTVQPHAEKGVLILDETSLDTYPVMFLISGWEYYGGKLLSPKDFSQLPAPEYIYIGQYGGFETVTDDASPHGSATYRLTIIIPAQPREFMLELPEIFSAYRAYINGEEVVRMGDPDHENYSPETGNRTVTFTASDKIEIVIAVSDFSHLYSGMTYPPAFGDPAKVAFVLNARLATRSAVCAVAIGVALLSLLIGLLGRNRKLTIPYSLLCIFFVGYVGYPLLHTFASGSLTFYAIENTSFCAVLLLTMYIQYRSFDRKDKWSRYFLCFGALCCAAAFILPFTAFFHSVSVMYNYSWMISAYEFVAAGYLTYMAVRAVISKTAAGLTFLSGVLVFNCALIMDRALPLYEPIRTGWFIEIASFVLVISIGAVIGQDIAAKYRESAVLTEREGSMKRLSEMQQSYFTVLRQEMDETKAVRHDLRHNFTVMKGFLQSGQYDKLAEYINDYHGPSYNEEPYVYTDNDVINILIHHYYVICGQNRIDFEVRCELKESLGISGADLCGALSNLLENAVEACQRIETGPRSIRLGITDPGDLIIRVENSTDTNLRKSGDTFFSSKAENRIGYGLASVRAIAKRYNGTATFRWDREKQLFTSIVSFR